jgi:hypothetical protein
LNSIKVTILNHYYCFSGEINVRENRRDDAEYEIQRDMQYWAHEDKPNVQRTTKGRLKQLWLIIPSTSTRRITVSHIKSLKRKSTTGGPLNCKALGVSLPNL